MPDGTGGPGDESTPSLRGQMRRVLRSDLGRMTGWAFLGELARFGSAAIAFILLARLLGATAFGRYAGALAFVSVFFPFATVGAGQLLIMNVARRPETFPTSWADALLRTAVGAALAIAVVTVLAPVVVPKAGLALIVLLALAELVGTSVVELSAQAYQAHQQLRSSSVIRATLGLARLGGLAAFVLMTSSRTAEAWVGWYLASSLLAAAVSVAAISRTLGAPRRDPAARPLLLSGLPYAFSLSAAYIQDDIDKTLVLRYEPASVAGYYTAGYRFFNIALLPLRSFLVASLPRFFQAGAAGLGSSVAFARRLVRPGLLYGGVTALLCVAVAPVIPALLGPSYASAASVLRMLAFLPLVRLLQFVAGDALTGAGFQRYRTAAQVFTCALNIVLNVVLIPRHSWRGAVVATMVSEAVLVGALLVIIAALLRSGRPPDHPVDSGDAQWASVDALAPPLEGLS